MCSAHNCLHSKVQQCVNVIEMFKIQTNNGPLMHTNWSFCVFKNIIMHLTTIVCTGWLKLQKLNHNAENVKYKTEVTSAHPTGGKKNTECLGEESSE